MIVAELLTPTEARRLLEEYGLAPRKSAGQNFLVDPNTATKIVRESGVGPDDVVLEVGPGLGALTAPLLGTVARLVAVEVDAGFVQVLRDRFDDALELVHADALEVDLGRLVDGGPARLVANLPYNIATPVVVAALDTGAFRELYVMVQREVGERWSAGTGDPLYSGVSVKLQLVADVRVEATVPRTVFLPVPNVDSVMVRARVRPDQLPRDALMRVRNVVDVAFGQRRKTLRKSLRAIAPTQVVAAALRDCGFAEAARPEELTVDDFVRLAATLDAGSRGAPPTMPPTGDG